MFKFITRYRHYLLPALAVFIFVMALIACHHLLAEVSHQAVRKAVGGVSALNLALAFAGTALSFCMLFGYEWSADKYAKAHLPAKTLALGSFCAFAVGNMVGLPIFSGGAVRYRIYGASGLSASKIIKMTVFAASSLALTLPFLTALMILGQSRRLSELLSFPQASLLSAGGLILLGYLIGLIYICKNRRPLEGEPNHFGLSAASYQIELPETRLAIGQSLITTLDITSAGLVLYFLVNGQIPPVEFLPVYFAAVAAGVISHVPGGIGVFEAVILAAFGPKVGTAQVAAALILYRLIYIALPFVLACLLLLTKEARRFGLKCEAASRSRLAPSILALLAFVSGVILLFSGATPALHNLLAHLDLLIPESLVETSHLMASVIGLICLLLAQGLYRKLSGAWLLTIIMLLGGGLFSLLKGLNWEEALFLFMVAGLTYAFKPCFYRKSRLSRTAISLNYLFVIGGVLAAAAWLSVFSYKNAIYNNQLLWQFSLNGDAARSIRALGACIIVFIVLALRWLLRPPFSFTVPKPDELDEGWAIFQSSCRPDGALVRLGDKALLFNSSRDAFIMYGHHGGSLVALFDPIGRESCFEELIWEFRDLSDRFAMRPMFYQVKEQNLHLYADIGLVPIKIGEEALVSLTEFSLESSRSKTLRYLYRQGLKNGLSMEVYEAGQAPYEKLRIISDQWLANKNTREKGFSLGCFEQSYLSFFKIAALKLNGDIVAFANLFETVCRQESSFDLMRYSSRAPKSSMSFLVTSLIIYYQNQGVKNLSLGMAPLSGLSRSQANSFVFNKVASFIYENGEYFYNFKGLRMFKEKFNPLWQPRYVALPRGGQPLMALKDASALISGRLLGLIAK